MHNKRIIARLDIKNDFVIKGIHLEGLRKIGSPIAMAKKYYDDGVDEIIFMDAVASLYGRNNLFHIISVACEKIFIPITIGGGIRSISDIDKALNSGADKITLNTQAVKTPEIILEASRVYGSQCIVGSIEAKRKGATWEVFTDSGREPTGINAFEWAKRLEDLGIGEIFITSIDMEGTKRGCDIDLIEGICESVNVPVIASGGVGSTAHVNEVFSSTGVSALAIASILHYNVHSVAQIKDSLSDAGINVRKYQA